MAAPSGERRQAAGKRTASLGSLMNQGGDTHRSSAGTLPELMAQGGSSKRGNPGTKKLKQYMGQ